MKSEIKLYTHDQAVPLLELSDNHTWWEIDNPEVSWYIFDDFVAMYLNEVERKYKDLEIILAGRSGRHVCIKDTPVNRRRYWAVQEAVLDAERRLITELNAWSKN